MAGKFIVVFDNMKPPFFRESYRNPVAGYRDIHLIVPLSSVVRLQRGWWRNCFCCVSDRIVTFKNGKSKAEKGISPIIVPELFQSNGLANRTVLAGFIATFQVTCKRFAALQSLESSSLVILALPPLTCTSMTVSSSGERLSLLTATRSTTPLYSKPLRLSRETTFHPVFPRAYFVNSFAFRAVAWALALAPRHFLVIAARSAGVNLIVFIYERP
jgi:hypothetical protein